MKDKKAQAARTSPIDRQQMVMRPVDVDKLIDPDHPARGIWELVGSLDLSVFYAQIDSVKGVAGRPAHDPQLLICLWIYSYSRGVASAREISRLCEWDPAYQWLTGLNWINHHTLSDFRMQQGEALQKLASEVLGVLSEGGLVALKRVVHDGTKVRANAGSNSFRRERRLREHIEMARRQIEEAEREAADESGNKRKQAARERAARERKQRLEGALKELEEIRQHTEKPPQECRASWTDPDSRIMKFGDGGYGPGYNVQVSTDVDSGVIVGVAVSQSASDQGLLEQAVEEVKQDTGRLPKQLIVDGGFITAASIVAAEQSGVELIGPAGENNDPGKADDAQAHSQFDRDAFTFDEQENCFTCPAGKKLTYQGQEKRGDRIIYRYQARAGDCRNCIFKDRCCPKARRGRRVQREVNSPALVAFIEKMKTDRAKQIYKVRGAVAEFSNLWIKTKNGLRQFSVRSLARVKLETLWVCLTYNIQLWLRQCWRPQLQTL